jgi:membrane complex biogenesis BtpA family protein
VLYFDLQKGVKTVTIQLSSIFPSHKPVIGMVHIPASPGQPQSQSKVDLVKTIDAVKKDIKALQDGGIDGLLFCNESDLPYTTHVMSEAGAWMAFLIGAVYGSIKTPYGVNLLWDPIASIETAASCGASFVREVMCGSFASDMGILSPDPALVAQTRTRLKAERIALFTNIVPEFASAMEGRTVAQRALAAEYFGFDAILISGPVAGIAFGEDDLIEAKSAAKNTPVFANTGVRAETIAKTLKLADGVIAGSGMKFDGKTFNPVDPARVVELIKAADKSR